MNFFTVTLALSIAAASPLLALGGNANRAASESETYWYFGARVAYTETPYRGIGGQLSIAPYIAYETERFYLGPERVSYLLKRFGDDEGLSGELSAILLPRFGRPDPDDETFLGTADRDVSLDAGLRATANYGSYYLTSTLVADVLGQYDGFSFATRVGKKIPLGEYSRLDLSLGASYFDNNLSEYLYGVTPAEATPTFAAYDPGGSWRATLEARLLQPISRNGFILTGVALHLLDSEASGSSLLDDDKQISTYLAIAWRF